ncbi:microtubule-associated protein [Achlya hypogyna]|uniref:Microtubule-associated protein n=1 Tax=Achlya hypogyna TaxID=1202772 RepID=A0A1V9ZB36_ACHHY|nr:microtubule-associated protein [Achlya hypogyna]
MGNAVGLTAVPATDSLKASYSATLIDAVAPFDNLSIDEIEAYWRSFYEHANGFALSKQDFHTICIDVACQLDHSPVQMAAHASALFDVLTQDTPAKLLDALEFLSSIVFISSASLQDKVELVFDSWDMSEDGALDIDEFTISQLKSTLMGLGKIVMAKANDKTPDLLEDDEVRRIAEMAFRDMLNIKPSTMITPELSITCDIFRNYCMTNSEARSLFDVFDLAVSASNEDSTAIARLDPTQIPERTIKQSCKMDPEVAIECNIVDASHGDEFMAVKPWEGAIIPPTNPPPIDSSAPTVDIGLDWVFGYSAQDAYARANVRYTRSGEITYPAASVVVVLDKSGPTQRHVVAHTDDILSFALHPSRALGASGETGKTPKIIVWDVTNMDVLSTHRGFHSRGILHVSFSCTGTALASLGADDDHSLGVYTTTDHWKTGSLTWFAKGNKAVPLGLVWHPTKDTVFATLGVKYLELWTCNSSPKSLTCAKGSLGKLGTVQNFLSGVWLPSDGGCQLVVGTQDGSLYLFQPPELRSVIASAHEGPVQCLYILDKIIVSGGKDGVIHLWTPDKSGGLIKTQFFDVKALSGRPAAVQSVCLSNDASMLVLGTQASDIFEINLKTKEISPPLIAGHHADELWGLASHPTRQECATVGDDRYLCVWDLVKKIQLRRLKLECPGRAVAYTPDGKYLAVGLGAQLPGREKINKNPKNGAVLVVYEHDLSKLVERNDAKKWISDVQYSPCGKYLAVGSHDNSIILYDAGNHYTKKHAFKKHSSFITRIDFSADSSFYQSTSGAYELLFTDVRTGKQVTRASALKDEQWSTWTCLLGWPVQGIWSPDSDGSDVNGVARSHAGTLLATGDDFCKVKLFRYPSAKKHAGFATLSGHSSHVTNIAWSANDELLLSTGGGDRCLFLWKHGAQKLKGAKASATPVPSPVKGATHDDDEDMDMLRGAQGDEFMAVKPWLGAIVPPSKLPVVDNTQPPNSSLTLTHAYGYQAQNASNNVRYLANGRVVYHVAALGVVYDSVTHTQQLFQGHDDDIVCLALHPNGSIVATGQMGKPPKIHVWELSGTKGDKCISLACLQGFHKRAVPALAFSTDGTKLCSIGNDDDHSMAIYKWKEGTIVASGKGERNTIHGVVHHPVTNEWISFGDKHVTHWTEQGRNITGKKAALGKLGTPQLFHCATMIPNGAASSAPPSRTVVGTHSGDIYCFENKQLVQALHGHKGPVYAVSMPATKAEWVSGGKDGKIIVWDTNLAPLSSFDIAPPLAKLFGFSAETTKQLQTHFAIRSVCFNTGNTRLLVGTHGSDIVQLDRTGAKATVVTQGHCKDELWGLAIHPDPTKHQFCTVGDDKTLRVWDAKHKMQLRLKPFDCITRACAYSTVAPYWIAVGLGGRIEAGRKHPRYGTLVVVRDDDSFAVVFEDKPSKEWLSEIKFSPDNRCLAVGSHDTAIYLYSINGSAFVKSGVFRKHASYITHFDFSSDSKYLQSNCGAYELLFSDPTTSKHITSAKSLRDVNWATWTCTLGWPVQGIWPPCADGTDVNAVHRSASGHLLVTGDDFGKVKLFRYPCVAKHSVAYAYSGHSSHVTNVRWLHADTGILSTGGLDRSILVWHHDTGAEETAPDAASRSPTKVALAAALSDTTLDDMDEVPNERLCRASVFTEGGGDEFMAVKPWLGAISAPSNPPKENPREPDIRIRLEWVYGYQSDLARNNLRYNSDGQIVYHAAAVGVVYDRSTNTQKHHLGHSDDILCLTMSSSGRFVATGERGKKPAIRVWDAQSGALLCELKGFHTRGVLSLAFALDEKTLASVGDDDDHSFGLWEDKGGAWRKGVLQTSAKGDKALNIFALSSPTPGHFVTGGVKHLLFWTVEGKTASSSKGLFGKLATVQTLWCACSFKDGATLTGGDNGDMYQWTGNSVSKSVKAHEGALTALYSTPKLDTVVSGGKDGKVCVWNSSLQQTSSFAVETVYPVCGARGKSIRSVCLDTSGAKVLLGTWGSDILEVDAATAALVLGKPVVGGHCKDELWGLAVHPTDPATFCTVGDDAVARVYNMKQKTSSVLMELDDIARAVAYSPDGLLLAIGYGGDLGRGKVKGNKHGMIGFYEVSSTTIVHEEQPSKAAISDVKFSAAGTTAAFGSHDHKIYIYGIQGSGGGATVSLKQVFAKHMSYISHFDFSRDGKYLQSNCGAYELLFSDVDSGKQMRSAKALKDVVWDTWTCTLGWPVQGIWPECADGTDINSVCASKSRAFLATGDDFSKVKIFRYPCLTKGAKWVQGDGHCSHVTCVRFTADDKYLLSTGGNDRAVLQWRLTDH